VNRDVRKSTPNGYGSSTGFHGKQRRGDGWRAAALLGAGLLLIALVEIYKAWFNGSLP
jgi:hypothetical protein